MKFFVPGVSTRNAETTYQSLIEAAKDQLRTPITPRRIQQLRYTHNKRMMLAEVGETHPEHAKFRIVAILESHPHIVLARSLDGMQGLTIMVSNDEITDVTEFDV